MSVSSPGPVPTPVPTFTAGTPVTAKTKASATDPSDKAKTAINADFDTFLKLLTTQMQNQDPLQPMESTQFVAQLASFSAVEQQIRTNDQLGSIFGALSTGNANLAEWIGREVRAPQSADFTGQPIEVDVTATPGADRTVLVVTNDFGREVSRTPVDATSGSVTWDGTDSLGTTVADGRYGFRLDSYDGDALLGSDTGRVFAPVEEVRIVDGSPMLVVGDGTQLALDEVSAVR
ncbi:flagellar basal-body rod modification protein FlgD [Amaricoccus macauensis]|uniref:Basal-body rod modification protein FlgD n=1 Tax=Amaricoccus macauensis TaxID=57001 RepID=A0A840STJ5_9RHOB|nr:flagellar hook capping FlgD N-terminal domain-containing protein [Amaricoccus macauensis]MBB5222512.1 flagellar basal-body rod modification protein FlgD [Amaricoccus macauensis]